MGDNIKLIIVDRKIPEEAKEKLSDYGKVVGFFTEGLTYPAISGHPDIFFCKTPQVLVIAPNLPEEYFRILDQYLIRYEIGNSEVGINGERKEIHHSAFIHYTAAVSDEYLVHALQYTEPVILQNCHYLKKISVKQGYTRCNLLLLDKKHYITSDKGTDESLNQHGLEGLVVSPSGILLPGFQNGFIGGTMGIYAEKIFITGSLHRYPEGRKITNYLEALNYEIVELYDGPLIDAGGILFL
jgi:ribosomal protein L30E